MQEEAGLVLVELAGPTTLVPQAVLGVPMPQAAVARLVQVMATAVLGQRAVMVAEMEAEVALVTVEHPLESEATAVRQVEAEVEAAMVTEMAKAELERVAKSESLVGR